LNLKGTRIVFKKEIKDLFRDKRTVIVGILLPLLIFPIMYGFMGKGMDNTNKKVTENLKISINDKGNSSLGKYIKSIKNISIIASKDIKKDVQAGKIYIGIMIPNDFEVKIKNEQTIALKIVIDDTSQSSVIAKGSLDSIIEAYSKEIIKNRLLKRNIDISILNPMKITTVSAAKEKGGSSQFLLALLLPMFLMMYSMSSPMTAAIDLGAGEKERGTLEPLLTTQTSRMNLLFGKLLAITLMGLIGTISSMLGLAISFNVSGSMFGGASMNLSLNAFILIGISALLLTITFGAVELAISIYARSFKEASTYLTPFTIIGMIAAFGTYSMDIKNVSVLLFNIPLINLSLIMKELKAGIYNPLHLGITLGWTLTYVISSILFARYMFSKEEVIFRT
jgi:sodium transport system permease protein